MLPTKATCRAGERVGAQARISTTAPAAIAEKGVQPGHPREPPSDRAWCASLPFAAPATVGNPGQSATALGL